MKRFISVMFALLLAITVLYPVGHVHDDQCGYDPETQTGCIYEQPQIDPLNEKDPHN
ncbi:MAG TPA: hypothetical protein IAD15_12210 [Candidatus Fimiplasma intestinipullorum]|uniref:Secreted protein n=1 Tax=Candidatus Fimiplasma intestinipullorum TaxID=2840825 RepID=A0A9D1HQ70_9FIRM|nr:hypothetical protein [Candidatus Fimiplasma intestinipullorum]